MEVFIAICIRFIAPAGHHKSEPVHPTRESFWRLERGYGLKNGFSPDESYGTFALDQTRRCNRRKTPFDCSPRCSQPAKFTSLSTKWSIAAQCNTEIPWTVYGSFTRNKPRYPTNYYVCQDLTFIIHMITQDGESVVVLQNSWEVPLDSCRKRSGERDCTTDIAAVRFTTERRHRFIKSFFEKSKWAH